MTDEYKFHGQGSVEVLRPRSNHDLVIQLTKALRGVAKYLPKSDANPAREIHIRSVDNGKVIAGCITHYDPEVMDVFDALKEAEKRGY